MKLKYSILFVIVALILICPFVKADQDFASEKSQDELNHEDALFSLAKSHKTLKHYDEAIQGFKNYIQNGSEKERIWYAQLMIGECYEAMKFWDHALHWYLRAYEYLPDRAEPLQKIAYYYRINDKPDLAYLFAKQGSFIPRPKDQALFVSAPVYDYQFDEEISIAAYYTPFKKDGFAAANRLTLKKNIPPDIKEQTYKNLLFYVKNLEVARTQPIEIELPPLREGAIECYYPMNPTIQKTLDGYDLICRTVNFSQKEGKEYRSRDKQDATIRTRNFFIHYDSDFNLLSQKEIIEDLPRKRGSWVSIVGLEDCRLINLDHNSWLLATTYDTHPRTPGQSLCQLASQPSDQLIQVEKLLPIQGPNPGQCEKNWLPFVKDQELHILYGYDPFIIYKLDKEKGTYETVVQYNPSYDFSHFRGSAAPIEFDNGYLVLIHEVVFDSDLRRFYLHRFLYLDKDFNVKKISKPFTFMHKGIEYSCGMTLDHSGKTCIIPIGYEDKKAYLLFVDLNTIRALLEPLSALILPSQAKGKDEQEKEKKTKPSSKALTINIISNKNGVGLSQDIDIFLAELTKLGHQPRFVADTDSNPPAKADINLFIQPLNINFFPYADRNYLIPHPEWSFLSVQELAKFDMILCKTKEAERIFKSLNAHAVYLSSTSKDCYNEKETKNFKSSFHLAGASIHKGTETVIKTWMDNPNFPSLFILKHKGNKSYPPAANLHFIYEYMPVDKLRSMQNQCGLHICPSETEGFGHYIMEAMSCGSVVVTTNAPPMNEFVLDNRCLVGYNRTSPWNLATNYYIDQLKLEEVMLDLLSLPVQELEEIGRKNREFYLKNDQLFKQRLAEIFGVANSEKM